MAVSVVSTDLGMNCNKASFVNGSKLRTTTEFSEGVLEKRQQLPAHVPVLAHFLKCPQYHLREPQWGCSTWCGLGPGFIFYSHKGSERRLELWLQAFLKAQLKLQERQTLIKSKAILFYTTHISHLSVGTSQGTSVAWFCLSPTPGTDSLLCPSTFRKAGDKRAKEAAPSQLCCFPSEKDARPVWC